MQDSHCSCCINKYICSSSLPPHLQLPTPSSQTRQRIEQLQQNGSINSSISIFMQLNQLTTSLESVKELLQETRQDMDTFTTLMQTFDDKQDELENKIVEFNDWKKSRRNWNGFGTSSLTAYLNGEDIVASSTEQVVQQVQVVETVQPIESTEQVKEFNDLEEQGSTETLLAPTEFIRIDSFNQNLPDYPLLQTEMIVKGHDVDLSSPASDVTLTSPMEKPSKRVQFSEQISIQTVEYSDDEM